MFLMMKNKEVKSEKVTLKPMSVYVNFEIGNHQMTLIVIRMKRNSKFAIITKENKEKPEFKSFPSVNLNKTLFEVVRTNGYLPYCDANQVYSVYKFERGVVKIRLHPSKDGSWEVVVIPNSGNSTKHTFPASMSQGDIMNTFISELGLPIPIGEYDTDIQNDIYD